MKKSKIVKILLSISLFAGVFAYMVVSSFGETMVYYKTVDELLEGKDKYYGMPIRVNGVLVPESLVQKPGTVDYRFKMSKRREVLNVSYSGSIPDAMGEDKELIVQGTLTAETLVFEATEILTKCPSKYEAKAQAIDP